tara:strand:+ start:558 stop:1121 length:564 start_codon:yes stop_codon:yes gene_type:complete
VELSNLNIKNGLCISLGSNIDSKFGNPINSLIESKYRIEKIISNLINFHNSDYSEKLLKRIFNWSSLYQTSPIGVATKQPDYINCLLLAKGDLLPASSMEQARFLLTEFQNLEKEFGRNKFIEEQEWLPRPLDIDILWWDDLNINEKDFKLPHPRFKHRNFVISPLAEVLSMNQKIEKLNIKNWIIN